MINIPMKFHDPRQNCPPPSSHVIQLTGTIFELNSRIKETNVLSKFHENWAKNVTSTKNAPPTGSHLVRDINKTNVLTNFHDDWAKIVTSRVFTRENCHYIHTEKHALPTGGHVFSQISTIFELILTNFHDDWAKIVTSRVLTRKTAPPTGGHVFQWIGTNFELNQDIIKTNILTNFQLGRDFIGTKLLNKFHEDGTRNQMLTDGRTNDGQRPVTKAHLSNQDTNVMTKFHEDWATELNKTRVLTRFYYSRIRKNAPPHWKPYIIETNLLTKFHEDWTINVASREKFPAPGGHVFKATKTIFELIQDIIGTKLQTKFHDDRKINVTSRVLTSGHAFLPIRTIFELNLFPCFHYIHIEKTAPPPGGHVFLPIWTIFELVQEINKTNVLTNFHDDWAKIVTSRVFTRKTAPPTGGHVFQHTRTTFELNQDIIKTNILTNFKLRRDFIGAKLLTKFHEDGTRNVASRVFKSKCLRTDGHTKDQDRSEKLT
ncbi:hypothetical protein DPMN_122464 [Dreissena polymorpha]|uniref:Uncharacterized protein n=1 Tax=Dreissena polymorpha TaxID=45954 RepID=A0A9D4JQF2_DREPO|nr:hypothetical protein DPMN_122464 [Dreissena polymorpha]